MGNKPNQSLMKIDSIKKENLVISDQVIIANEFNKYFSSIGQSRIYAGVWMPDMSNCQGIYIYIYMSMVEICPTVYKNLCLSMDAIDIFNCSGLNVLVYM